MALPIEFRLTRRAGRNRYEDLVYTGMVALLYPICALLFMSFADRIERKMALIVAAAGMVVFGLIFASWRSPGALIALGALVTLLSYSGHAYQSELYPTNIRARAVRFVYTFSVYHRSLRAF